jgi:hypothetical protein
VTVFFSLFTGNKSYPRPLNTIFSVGRYQAVSEKPRFQHRNYPQVRRGLPMTALPARRVTGIHWGASGRCY